MSNECSYSKYADESQPIPIEGSSGWSKHWASSSSGLSEKPLIVATTRGRGGKPIQGPTDSGFLMRTLFHSKGKSVFSAYKYSGKLSFCRDHHCHHPHPYFTHYHYYHRLYNPMLIQGPSGVYRQYHWELGEVLLELANNNTRVLLGIATTTTLHLPSSFCFHCNRHHHLHLYNHRDFFLFSKLLKPFNVSVSAVLPFLKCVFLIYVFPSERGFELLTNLRFKVVLSFVSILQTGQICHAALRHYPQLWSWQTLGCRRSTKHKRCKIKSNIGI